MALNTLLIPFSTWLLEKIGEKAFEKITSSFDSTKIDKRFKVAVLKTVKESQAKYPSVLGNSIEDFFTHGEVYEELYKLLFKDARIDTKIIKEHFDLGTLPMGFIDDFLQTLKRNCLADIQLNEILSNNNIYVSILGISQDTSRIAQISFLSLEEIKKIRELLLDKFNHEFDVSTFLKRYSKAAIKVLSELNFLGLGVKSHIKKNRKKLSDVYVKPVFTLNHEKDPQTIVSVDKQLTFFEPDELIQVDKIFNYSTNLVILGNPGSGKSVLVKYLMCNILEDGCDKLIENNEIHNRIPLRVELRKYFQFKKQTNEGLVKYLIKSIESDYGIINITEENIESIFKEAKILIFFDGLDEIFNATDKLNITHDIETLLQNYSNVLCVVTSRLIGYEEANLSKENFIELKILDFNDEQIIDYANKWYLQEENDAETRTKEVADFLKLYKSIDEELIRNPLLLSLIIILFRNNLKLPESKLEIYQSCTKTLVEKWDLTKELKIELPDEIAKKKETLFADLAFWQYEKLSSDNVKITNSLAISTIADSITNKLKITDDWIIAESYAEQFMYYALKRSLYFDNNFTHKTFLEYFTAYWIFSNIEKKHKTDERNEIISKYVDVAFWAIVLELLINMIDQDQPDTEIIDGLFSYQIEAKTSSIAFLLEITSSIKNISHSTISDLVYAAINLLISSPKKIKRGSIENRHFQSLILFVNNNENQQKIFKQAFYQFTKLDLTNSSFKNLLFLYLEMCFQHRTLNFSFDKSDFYYYDKIEKAIEADPHLYLFYHFATGWEKKDILKTMLFVLEKFGDYYLFKAFSAVFDSFYLSGFFYQYIYWQLKPENFKTFESNMRLLYLNGLSKLKLLKYLKDENNFFYTQASFSDLQSFIADSTTDNLHKLICYILIWKIKYEPYYRHHQLTKSMEMEIAKLAYNPNYKQFVEQLIESLNLTMFSSDEKSGIRSDAGLSS
jgi:hypothetical protein